MGICKIKEVIPLQHSLGFGVPFPFLLITFFIQSCIEEKGPLGEEFPIYVSTLTPGFDIGVTSSGNQYDWLHDMGSFMKMEYPLGQKNGSVFIVVGAVPFEKLTEDFSDYEGMVVELKSDEANTHIGIGIEDRRRSYVHPQFALELSQDWKTYYFSFSGFGSEVDLSKIRTVIKFLFIGDNPKTVYFRNIQYLKTMPSGVQDCFFPVFIDGFIHPDYELNVAEEDTPNNDSIALEVVDDYLEIYYPAEEPWSSVFFIPKDQKTRDFSLYYELCLEIKGSKGGEAIHVGVLDTNTPAFSGAKYPLDGTSWSLKHISIKSADLSQLISPAAFPSLEEESRTVFVRNIYLNACD